MQGLGVDSLSDGMVMGFGMCLNDGDTEGGQGGQKGWTGWGPYSIVYGKNSPASGLMTLVGDPPASSHWVACGSSANGCTAESPYLALDTEQHEVSCCNSEEGFAGVDGFDSLARPDRRSCRLLVWRVGHALCWQQHRRLLRRRQQQRS